MDSSCGNNSNNIISCTKTPTTTRKIPISILVISLPLLYASLLHMPPSSLFKDTTFWFLISNSIIVIVAADSGIFASSPSSSSSSTADDLLYDEYIKYSSKGTAGSNACLVTVPPSPVPVKEGELKPQHNANVENDDHGSPKEPEPKAEVTEEKDTSTEVVVKETAEMTEEAPKQPACKRSSSELSRNTDDQTKSLIPRSKTMMEKRISCGMEESEYWKLSDEELNRRVEEFITRFNREIRLQEKMSTVY